jgi:NitT/TauT family transport system ATP-binding protein
MTKLAVTGVRKQFGDFLALDGLSFEVADGEFFVLVGPSGCGKSTLLDLMAGLARPTHGTVALDGSPVTGPGLNRGVVFQQYALLPWRTAQGNVELGLEIKGEIKSATKGGLRRAERRRIAQHYLGLVGLADFADRYPEQLSGGMRQRVAIARSLAFEPDVLLMDEPFGALDAQTREALQDQLLEIQRSTRKTVVFITHDIEEAVYLGDRVGVLTARPGKIKQIFDICLSKRQPGGGEVVRSSAGYARYRHEIWLALRRTAESNPECEVRVA